MLKELIIKYFNKGKSVFYRSSGLVTVGVAAERNI